MLIEEEILGGDAPNYAFLIRMENISMTSEKKEKRKENISA